MAGTGTVVSAMCGGGFGTGLYFLGRSLRPRLAPDRTGATIGARWAWMVTRRFARIVGPVWARRLLLADDLAVLDVDPAAHTITRMMRLAVALCATVVLEAGVAASGLAVPAIALPTGGVAAVLAGVAWADRPLRRRANARRQEARLAVAAYLDLVRILLVGGLPLHTALQSAADAGRGWAFAQIRGALRWARARHAPPDAGLDRLARRIPVAEFAELRLTVSSALRGASPVLALQSKSAHLRAAEAAQARLATSTADAAMELPAVAVALAFVAFLTVPLLAILTGVNTTP
jgi:Flp pilus assembly protein TadB